VNYASGRSEAVDVVRSIGERGGRAAAIQADIAREADILRMFAEAERELGPVCGLVNNAGVTGGFARVEAISAEALERLLAVNVTGAILCAREAVKRMSTRQGGQGGAIVNISSLAARTGSPGE
jgi:NAD(P)-dependent dehydrogenase (short-subunit alcohol dehydrogenase family)